MALLHLREFWTVIVDLIISAVLYFGGKYLAPGAFEDLKWVVLALQPIAALLIAVFATERINAASKAAVEHLYWRLKSDR